jgi:predicted HTH transcriptional regulator
VKKAKTPPAGRPRARVSARQVDRWCAAGETQDVEFKRDASLERDDIVAMANAGGGVFLLGVEEYTVDGIQKGRVLGLKGALDKIQQGINHVGRDCLPPVRPRIERVYHPNGSVMVVFIDKPPSLVCTPRGRYVIRVGGGIQPIDPAKLLQMLLDQESASFLQRFQTAADEILRRLEQVSAELKEELASLHTTLENIEGLQMLNM